MVDDYSINEGDVTLISPDIEFSGELELENKLMLQGLIKGSISSKSSIHVDPNGTIIGDIRANFIDVQGRVQGTIKSSKFVHVQSSAAIKADICCEEIQIDRKASVRGVILTEEPSPA